MQPTAPQTGGAPRLMPGVSQMKSKMNSKGDRESITRLRADLVTARILVWVARAGRDVELTREAHLYFFDRYRRLSEYHRRHGHEARARRLQAKADEHAPSGGSTGPPYAAAMGMPCPRAWLVTEAVSRRPGEGPDDAA
jgi:hypothetical protein